MQLCLLIVLALVACGAGARAGTVTLANGDTLNGEIVEWAVDHLVLEHAQLGTLRLSLDQLKLDTGEPPSPGLFDTRFLRGWRRRLNLGISGEAGESLAILGGLNFDYADEFKHWRLTGRYYFNQNQDGENDNNSRLDLRRDWLIPTSRWFTFGQLRHQFDDTEPWEHRISTSAGPGYHLIQTETVTLDAVVGPVYVREFGERSDDRFESLAGVDLGWRINDRLRFQLSNELFTQLAPQPLDLRNLTIGELSLELSESPALSLLLNAENEYELQDEDGLSNTLNYGISLALDF